MSADEDCAKGTGNNLKGKIKVVAGKLTGDRSLQSEGKLD